jgi:amino acid transporter
MTPIEIQAILQYGSHFFPGLIDNTTSSLTLSGNGYAVAIALMFFVVVLNSYGIKLLTECNKYASILKFILPTIAIVALINHAPSVNNIHISLTDKESWVQVFSVLSAGGVAFAFTGFQNGLMLAGEVKNPQRNIPIAILGAVIIGFVLYFMLEFSFIIAIPKQYLTHGWQALSYPGDSGPLVGLTLLLGLGLVATLLMIDAMLSPFGTTLVYTAATSRIVYGMALNKHVPKVFLKVNRHDIPYITLYANFLVGILAFLPFQGWQKLVAFLSSASILSYGIGPICLLAMRTLQPNIHRPFKLAYSQLLSHIAFYVCNLMLYWCGFSVLWKLDVALAAGLVLCLVYHRKSLLACDRSLVWFIFYMSALVLISYCGSFGGRGLLSFPMDILCILPFSIAMLYLSQVCIPPSSKGGMVGNLKELPA